MNEMIDSRKEIGDYIFVSKYARTVNGKKETWNESVDRVMDMHYRHLTDDMAIKEENEKELDSYLKFAERLYRDQVILGAQRALQYGGDSLLKNHSRNFNCTGSYIDRIEFFQELMYLLLCGAGAGYSVQRVHAEKLPKLKGVDEKSDPVNIVIDDSIEGWAFTVGEVVKAHYLGLPSINFDYSLIRPKGSFISGGFKAPGPEPLKKCIEKLNKMLRKIKGRKATPFELHRMACIIADAVISGGIRRSALLCQFDADDEEMLNCKTGNWFSEYPELARANNSAVILPNTPKETYDKIFKSIKEFGEPGLVFLSHKDIVYNPCCFTGDTLVAVADGRNAVSIKDLSEEHREIPIYYKNRKGKVCISNGKAFCTGEKKVIRIILSNGSSFRCTEDHPLQTINGDYIKAIDSVGFYLSKFFSSKRKYRTINSFTNGFARQYRMIWEFHNGEKPESHEIDHIDNNRGDFIDNLQLLSQEDHLRKTSIERLGSKNPIHKADSKKLSESNKVISFLENNSRYSGLSNIDLIEIGRVVLERGMKLTRSNCQKVNIRFPAGFSKNRFNGSWELYKKYVNGELDYINPISPVYDPVKKPSLNYLSEEIYVVDIIDDNEIEEVYDIEMDCDEHNFGIITVGDFDYGNSEGVFVHNCEVGMFPKFRNKDGVHESGFSFCNLTEINGAKIKTREQFLDACKGAAILGTIQASYTNFKVLSPVSKKIAERDALIGVGITGMCENPEILFDPQLQEEGARVVKEMNRRVADLIGINHAARTTVIKPSGNSSQLLGCTSSGIHKFHFKRFIRNIQAANTEQALQHVKEVNPVMVRSSVYNKEGESVISFPVELDDNVLTSEDSSALDFLKLVKLTKEHWIEAGTNFDHPFYKEYPEMKDLRMNVSNTCTVKDDEWDEVREYVWKNKDVFSGISFLPKGGDLIYPQAPYTSVLDEKELAERYGAGAILAGGLIVDGLAVFNDDLWLACDVAMGRNNHHLILTDKDISDFILSHLKDGKLLVEVNGVMISDVNAISSHLQSIVDKKVDWVRRFKNFATKYLDGDLSRTEFCLKHVSLFHRWQKLKGMKHVDWESVAWNEEWVDAGSTVAQACSGGTCELK